MTVPLPKKHPLSVYCPGFFSVRQHPTVNDTVLDIEFIIGEEKQNRTLESKMP